MSFTAILLVATGAIMILVSCVSSRQSRLPNDHLAVHKDLSDDRISNQMKKGSAAGSVTSSLGVSVGVTFVIIGVLWQLVSLLI